MKAVQVKEGIYWVGALDWHIRKFPRLHDKPRSYLQRLLIIDEKITLIDTVKAPLCRRDVRAYQRCGRSV